MCHVIGVTAHPVRASQGDIARAVRDDHRRMAPGCSAGGDRIRLAVTIPDARKMLEGKKARGLCSTCAEEREGEIRVVNGRRLFVCDVCENEHPRMGRYNFGGGASSSVGNAHRIAGEKSSKKGMS